MPGNNDLWPGPLRGRQVARIHHYIAQLSFFELVLIYIALLGAAACLFAVSFYLLNGRTAFGDWLLHALFFLASASDRPPPVAEPVGEAPLLVAMAVLRVVLPSTFFGAIVFKVLQIRPKLFVFLPRLLLRRHHGALYLDACSTPDTKLEIVDLEIRTSVRFNSESRYYPLVTEWFDGEHWKEQVVDRRLPTPFNDMPTLSARIRIDIAMPERSGAAGERLSDADYVDLDPYLDPRDLRHTPIVLEYDGRGVSIVRIAGEVLREAPDEIAGAQIIFRLTGILPALDRGFNETHSFKVVDMLGGGLRWSPRWDVTAIRPHLVNPFTSRWLGRECRYDWNRATSQCTNWEAFDEGGWDHRTYAESGRDPILAALGEPPERHRQAFGQIRDRRAATDPAGYWKIRAARAPACTVIEPDAVGDTPIRRAELDQVIAETGKALAVEYLSFPTEPGLDDPDPISAIVLKPAGDEPRPAALCLHQSTPDRTLGKWETAGLGDPAFAYALELACRGFVTMAIDYPGYGPAGDACLDRVYDELAYESALMKGLCNHVQAVDVLAARADVDPGRIACVGHSLGGTNALLLGAMDHGIRAVVSSCGFASFGYYSTRRAEAESRGEELPAAPGDLGELDGWARRKYMPNVAGCSASDLPFDFDDVIALIAPRPLFVNAPRHDGVFDLDGVRRLVHSVKLAYLLERTADSDEDDLLLRHPDAGHDWPAAVRQEAYAFLARKLGPASA